MVKVKVAGKNLADVTDSYFTRTKNIVHHFGDAHVTYAFFMRRPVVCAPRMALDFINEAMASLGESFQVDLCYEEGKWVGAGEPLMFLTGSFEALVELETVILQKLGPVCVAAYNAAMMCMDLPKTHFIAMDARHCAGTEMAHMMAYAASVGSRRAHRKNNAQGFVGGSTHNTAHFFDRDKGIGTMPHALIGYAGSTVRAAEMFHEVYPDDMLTVLVDYFGAEVSDALAVCHRFPELAEKGLVAVRLDTVGSRFCEGLDPATSYQVLDRHVPGSIRGFRTEQELSYLVGPGVSAAAVWYMRESLDKAGFPHVKIVASSGFTPEKCHVMSFANAPVDVVGTGGFLPRTWPETYATSDIIAYNGEMKVKTGREFLFGKWQKLQEKKQQ